MKLDEALKEYLMHIRINEGKSRRTGISYEEDLKQYTAWLKEKGIYAAFHYIPLHSAAAGLKFGRFSGEDVYTTRESERLLRLPMFYNLAMEDAAYVAQCVLDFPEFNG